MQTSIVLILLLASLQASMSTEDPFFLGNMPIGRPGNYAEGSAYHKNLQKVLSTLDSAASTSTYSSISAGNGSDTVYGRYYCRHDVSLATCTACVAAATKQIVSAVNNSKEAIIWYEHCTLLYLTSISRLDAFDVEQFPSLSVFDDKSNVTDPENFYPILMNTMNWIINGSSYGFGSTIGFATAEAKVSPFKTLYSLAQCSWDTPGLLCERCLRRALHEYTLCCKDTAQMGFFYATCQLRYSVVAPFYDVRLSTPAVVGAPPAPAVASQASTSTTKHDKPPQGQGNSSVRRSWSDIVQTGIFIALITLMLLKSN